jgi:hypothetical protein
MLITQKRIQNLIREELITMSLLPLVHSNEVYLRESVNKSHVYLVESSGRRRRAQPRVITFGTLMERYDRGMITENQMVRLWSSSVDYQLAQINEGMMDVLKSAYETTKSGVIKFKDTITSAAATAMEKVNDMFLKMAMQAMSMAQKGIEATVKMTRKIMGAIERFREAHPILFKIVVVVTILAVIAAMMIYFQSGAQASVQMKGGTGKGGTMGETQWKLLRGALDDYGNSKGMGSDAQFLANDAIEALDKAYHSGQTIDISKLTKLTQNGMNMVNDRVAEMQGGDEVARNLLTNWFDVGERLQSVVTTTAGTG